LLDRLKADLVAVLFMIELDFLHGREKLPPTANVHAMMNI
jgi:adenine/guanine phosphoribosyltransferase-like PRPP-binding protein